MSKRRKAVEILKHAMQAGESSEMAAKDAEYRTGLSIIPAGPVPCLRYSFFLLSRDGKRVLGRYRVHRAT